MKLYEINNKMMEIMNREVVNDDEFVSLQEEFASLTEDRNEKIDNCVKAIRNIESDINAVDEEIARLNELKKGKSKRIDNIKSLIDFTMSSTGETKLETSICKISYRKSKSLIITDESLIPDKYKTIVESVKIDKMKMKKGGNVPGTTIQEKHNLQIK